MLIRTTDPIHFYNSDLKKKLFKLELLKIYQNQSKNNINTELDFKYEPFHKLFVVLLFFN